MKNYAHELTILCLALCSSFYANAGTLSYQEIPPTGSDAGAEINGTYTGAVYGNLAGGDYTINGVPFSPLKGEGDTLSANHIEVSSAVGTLSIGGDVGAAQSDGLLSSALSSAISNTGATDNSEQYVVLDPSTLVAGKTYDLRIYVRKGGNENRLVNLTFAGDGQPPVSTDFFNEDDATTSPAGFDDPKQVYSINYRFKWDGVTTPGITITQKFGRNPFLFYAASNLVAPETNAVPAQPIAPVQQVQPTPRVQPVAVSLVSKQKADVGVESDEFYSADSLKNNGEWVSTGRYGNCWRPTVVSNDWSPYTDGYWRHSASNGWIWISNEPWGWATYHYGRWIRERDAGWIWIPGRKWAPAWVSWRYGNSYTGWAPLPPDAAFDDQAGITVQADTNYDIGPDHYHFVHVHDFGRLGLRSLFIPRSENVTIVQNTTNITNIVSRNSTIYNGGPNFNVVNNIIKRHGGEVIPEVQIDRRGTHGPLTHDGKFSQMNGNTLSITAPVITSNGHHTPDHIKPIQSGEFDKGWSGVKDPTLAAHLKTKMGNESGNLPPQNTGATNSSTNPTQGHHRTNGLQQGQTAGQSTSPDHTTTGAVPPVVTQQGTSTTGKHRPGSSFQTPVQTTTGAAQPALTQQGTSTTGTHRPGNSSQTPNQTTTGALPPVVTQQGTSTTGKHRPGSSFQTPVQTTTGAAQPALTQQGTSTTGTHHSVNSTQTEPPQTGQQGSIQGNAANGTTGKKRNSSATSQTGTVGSQTVTSEKQPGLTVPQPGNTRSQPTPVQNKQQAHQNPDNTTGQTGAQTAPVTKHSNRTQSADASGAATPSVKHHQETTPAQTSVQQNQAATQPVQRRQAPTPQPVQQRQAPTPQPVQRRQAPTPQPVQQRQAPAPQPIQQRQAPAPQPVQQRQAPAPQPAAQAASSGKAKPTPTPVGH